MLPFDPDHTSSYYDKYGARESERWNAGPRATMQRAIFRHHLQQRIKRNDRVLDAGSGPGTFAKDMIELGAKVTCLDISQVQLEACRQQAPECEAYEHGTVTDLSRFDSRSFEVAMALGGALSYSFDQTPVAVSELVRVTRPGGLVGMSVMNLFGTIHSFLSGVLSNAPSVNQEILRSGDLPRALNDGHECHLFRVDELRDLLSKAGLKDIEVFAAGWLVPDNKIEIPECDSEAWRFLFEAELEACRASPGAGSHIIAWGCVQ